MRDDPPHMPWGHKAICWIFAVVLAFFVARCKTGAFPPY